MSKVIASVSARGIAAGALLCAATLAAHAQPAWKPEKSVDIIVGTSPGGPQDHMGRMLQKVLQESRLMGCRCRSKTNRAAAARSGLPF